MSKKPELSDVPGVGPKLEEKLKGAGIKTVAKLSKSKPEKLAGKIEGLGESNAEKIISAALKIVESKPKKEAREAKPPKKEGKPRPKKPKKETKAELKKPKVKPKLDSIPGIGASLQKKLVAAGYDSVAKIASAEPEAISAEISGLSADKAKSLISDAKKLRPKPKKAKPKPVKPKKKAKHEPPKRDQLVDHRLLRIAINKRKIQPQFRHEQAHRWKRVSNSWRKVRGIDSATREKRKGRISMVSTGYRKPRAVRGLHPSRFIEIYATNPSDLEGLDPEIHAVRISSTVGMRKRQDIIKKADAMLLRVLNPGAPEALTEEELFADLGELEEELE